jgi:hypothetical protein
MHLQEENKFNNIYTIQKYGRGLDNQGNDMAALGKVRRIWLGMNNWAIFRGCNTHTLN